jgi:hypothetical protein
MKIQNPSLQRPRVDQRYDDLLRQSFTLQKLLLPSELGAVAHFVVVGEYPISIEDLDAALHMDEVEGFLDAQEIQAIIWPELDNREGAWPLQHLESHLRSNEEELRSQLESARKSKRKRILGLAGAYLKSSHGEIPRKDALLMGLSRGKLHFSDLGSYLTAAASLDESGAELVSTTAGEVRGVLEAQSREVSAKSSEALGSAFSEREFSWLCQILGVQPEGLLQTPTVVMERALVGHSFDEQDARQVFSYDRQRAGVSIPFSIERQVGMAGVFYSVPAFLSAIFLGSENPLTLPLILSAVGAMGSFYVLGIGTGLGFTPFSTLAKHLVVSGKKSTLTAAYLNDYKGIRARIDMLNKIPTGRMKVLFLELWVQNKTGVGSISDQDLDGLYDRLLAIENDANEKAAFEAFFGFKGESYFGSTPFAQILEEFEQWPRK